MTRVIGVVVFLGGCIIGVDATKTNYFIPDGSLWWSIGGLFVALVIAGVGVEIMKRNDST